MKSLWIAARQCGKSMSQMALDSNTVRVIVNVTQEIIDSSDGRDFQNCMVYNALLPLCSGLSGVSTSRVYLTKPHGPISLPTLVALRVRRHWMGFAVKPFKFSLRLPKECLHVTG